MVTDYARLIFALSVVVSLLSFAAVFFFLRVKKAKVQRQILQEQRNAELKAMEAEYAANQVNIYRATPANGASSSANSTNTGTSTSATGTASPNSNATDKPEQKIKDLTSM